MDMQRESKLVAILGGVLMSGVIIVQAVVDWRMAFALCALVGLVAGYLLALWCQERPRL